MATPLGRGVVLASTVIDATGNADVAAWAGAQTQFGISENGSLNVQIAGFPERPLQRSYVNTCYTMVDDTDVLDVWHLMAWKRTTLPLASAFDVGQLVDSRERRRVVGDYTLTVPDILTHRTFPDTISQHYSNFDAAAFPDSRLLLVRDAKGPCFHTDLPYRCLLPRGLDGILVVGLGASAERDAMTLIRMQADLQNQGYAAGLAAAAAVKAGGHTRDIDIKALQKELIRQRVLDERVYTDKDSYPMSTGEIERAVQAIGGQGEATRCSKRWPSSWPIPAGHSPAEDGVPAIGGWEPATRLRENPRDSRRSGRRSGADRRGRCARGMGPRRGTYVPAQNGQYVQRTRSAGHRAGVQSCSGGI